MFEKAGYLTPERAVKERSLLRNVYMWMTGGLAFTGVVSLWMLSDPMRIAHLFQSHLIWVIFIGKLGLVFFLSARIMKMSPQTAVLAFITYSGLTGVTLSAILFAYTTASITSTLFITAGTFAGMSLYAMTTKRDLSSIGSYLMMGLIGLIIASVVNIFLGSSTLHWLVSFAGVLIFCGLVAYDTQHILKMSRNFSGSIADEDYMRFSILGALKLYLDFINLFIFLLRIFGQRR